MGKVARRCYHSPSALANNFLRSGASSAFAIGSLAAGLPFLPSAVRLCAMYSPLLITTNFIRHRARLGFVFIVRACGIDAVAAAASPFVNELEFRISAHPLLLTLFSSA